MSDGKCNSHFLGGYLSTSDDGKEHRRCREEEEEERPFVIWEVSLSHRTMTTFGNNSNTV